MYIYILYIYGWINNLEEIIYIKTKLTIINNQSYFIISISVFFSIPVPYS